MRAAVLTQAAFEIREIDVPTFGACEVLVRTVARGVCTGDLYLYENRAELGSAYRRLGHEASGIVAGIGPDVIAFAEGDVVTALSMPAYVDFFVAAPDQLVALPPVVDPVNALGEPIACCVHAGARFGTVPGDRVAVIGCGFMGLVRLQIARYQGAGFICALDPDVSRLDMSIELGADVALALPQDGDPSVPAHSGEFHIVIDAAGTQGALDGAAT